MKIPPQMIELFLRSSGAPAASIEMARLIQKEGFSQFTFQPMSQNDPNWKSIGSNPDRKHSGVWVRAEGPNSRVTVAIFLEGTDDKILEAIGVFSADLATVARL